MPPESKVEEAEGRTPLVNQRRFDENTLPRAFCGFGLLLVLCLGLSWYLVNTLTHYGESIQRSAMLAIASAAAVSFDANSVKSLKGSAEEQPTAAFLDVREQLQRMRAAIHDSRFSYLMARRDGDVIFLADAEPLDSPNYSPPGQVYDEATDALRGVFVTKKPIVEGPVTDRWGDWVSGLAPIIDPESRNVVAVYGFDVSAKNWQATIARFRWLAFTISGLVTTTIVLFGLFGLGQLRLAAKTRYTARHDVLTGLLNRRVFVERVQQIVSERGDQGLAVLYLDLDHFKDVNDTLGHSVGDEFLRAVAERLRRNVRQTDCVARCGGDEFAVVIEGGGISAEAEKLAARLVSSIGEPFKIDGNNIRSNASIGIAVCKSRDDDAEMILSHADIALYQAKSEGRGSYQYSPKRWTRKCAHA